jgi:hypothetical protein
MAPARGSLSSIAEYSPPSGVAPPPPSELTSERAVIGLSRGTVALAVLTAFAVGTAVGLVIAPSSAPAGKAAEVCPPSASAIKESTPVVTAEVPATAPPVETLTAHVTTASASSKPSAASTGKAALTGSLSSLNAPLSSGNGTAKTAKTAAPRPSSDGLGEDEPPKPKPTATPLEL